MPQEASLPGPAAPQERRDPDDYLAALLASAPADVRERLTEIGEQNLARMRDQQVRDPGTPSGTVEHADDLVPGRRGDPDVPVRLHRERGIAEPRPALISLHAGAT